MAELNFISATNEEQKRKYKKKFEEEEQTKSRKDYLEFLKEQKLELGKETVRQKEFCLDEQLYKLESEHECKEKEYCRNHR